MSALLIFLAVSAQANETYTWTGGMPGYSGTIVLDSSSSPNGGGTMADIVSAEITVPLPGFFGTQEYTFNFDSLTASSFTPLVWNPDDITGMEIRWQDVPSFVNDPNMGNNYLGDYNSNEGVSTEDDTGSWQADPANPPINVPDGESTAGLMALSAGVIGCARLRLKKCL
jgi:hypothetical protein